MRTRQKDIAIVGIGCRFPGGADTPQAFWSLMRTGIDAVTEIPADRWSVAAFYHPEAGTAGATTSKWGGFIAGIDRFDPDAFGISPREAAVMDPQQRLMLEVAREAIDDSGRPVTELAGSATGVFVGVSTWDFAHLQSYGTRSEIASAPFVATGIAHSIVANRISYCFDLGGPSTIVDTACSSALVAVHLACESIRSGESALAIAGGVNVLLTPGNYIAFSAMGMLSRTGRCRPFDAAADGFVRSEGAGAVLLKPVARALADGDRIYAVIRGTGVNQDGRTNGLQVPSVEAQEALLRRMYSRSVDAADLAYLEAHGTGTPVGDPIEAKAIGHATTHVRRHEPPLLIGSVKSNLGHLEAAAGIAGLIKAALVLHHRAVPATLHFSAPSRHIDFEGLGLTVPRSLVPLAPRSRPMLAGVNSFGFGGTNCHAILGESPARSRRRRIASGKSAAQKQAAVLIPLSASSASRLKTLAASWVSFIGGTECPELGDVAYTAALRREPAQHRLCVAATSKDEVRARLETFLAEGRAPGLASGSPLSDDRPRVAFVFSGQGPQWWGMGRTLLDGNAAFRAALEECDTLFRPLAGWSILEALAADEHTSRMHETAVAQPAIFAMQVALLAAWRSYGVEPDLVTGHSVGEVAAAYAAGMLDLHEAVLVIHHRARCMSVVPPGGRMLSLRLPHDEAVAYCTGFEEHEACVAALNGPYSTVLAGRSASIREIARRCEQDGISAQPLDVEYAFHSPELEPIEEALRRALDDLACRRPTIPFVSGTTGALIEDAQTDADYWWRNVRRPVRFLDAFRTALGLGCRVAIELSPHPILLPHMVDELREQNLRGLVVASARRREDENLVLLTALGALHCAGYPVEWRRIQDPGARCVSLPLYPWQREPFWAEAPGLRERRLDAPVHPLLGTRGRRHRPVWVAGLDLKRLPYLKDHRLQGRPVFPATGYIDAARAACEDVLEIERPVIEDFRFRRPFFLSEGDAPSELTTEFDEEERELRFFGGTSSMRRHPTLNAVARVSVADAGDSHVQFDPQEVIARCPDEFDGAVVYAMCTELDLEYGPAFQGVEHFWRSPTEVLARIEATSEVTLGEGGYFIHPAHLDACLQALTLNRSFESWRDEKLSFVPVRIARLQLFRRARTSRLWMHVLKRRDTARYYLADAFAYDAELNLVAAIRGFEAHGLEPNRRDDGRTIDDWVYEPVWVPCDGDMTRARSARATIVPRLAEIAAELRARPEEAGNEIGRDIFPAAVQSLDDMAVSYIAAAFSALGLVAGWSALPEAALFDQLGIDAGHRRFARALLRVLEQAGRVQRVQGGWSMRPLAPVQDAAQCLRAALGSHPSLVAELVLLHRAGSALPEILTGRRNAIEALHPGGLPSLAEHLDQDAPARRARHRLVASCVLRIAAHHSPGRLLRILEIGAATGGVTAHLLGGLPADRCQYVLTDPTTFLVTAASKQFRDVGFVECRVLDLSRDPREQSFESQEFDIVVAPDALHRAEDVRRALRHARSLLAPGGVLVVAETARLAPWELLVVGADGRWDRVRDASLRPTQPLLDQAQWRQLLDEQFTEVAAPLDSSRAAKSGTADWTLLIARGSVTGPGVETSGPANPVPTPSAEGGRWLVLADQAEFGDAVAAALRARGASCDLLDPPSAEATVAEVLTRAATAGEPYGDVVHLLALGCVPSGAIEVDTIRSDEARTCTSVVDLVRGATSIARSSRPRIHLVTCGMRPIGVAANEFALAQSPLAGMSAGIAGEHTDLKLKCIDLDPADDTSRQVRLLLEEVLLRDAESEIAFREGGQRYACRLRRTSLVQPLPSQRIDVAALDADGRAAKCRYGLPMPKAGKIVALALRESSPALLRSGQVEVAVVASALNFRDVLKVLGVYPPDREDSTLLGDEFAGTVTSVGEGVHAFRPGDRVFGIGPASLSSHVVTVPELLMPLPAGLREEDAVTLPIAFFTAWYGLHHIARIASGETVLVHAAAGGVGQAAIQVAHAAGAEIFATASASKRDVVHLLGARAVMDSRSLDWADEVMNLTHGRGVDVVLNSLSHEAIQKGISVLAPYGRFLELGRRDIYEGRKLDLSGLKENISFHAIDLSRLLTLDPAHLSRIKKELLEGLAHGRLTALPHRDFGADRLVPAFRTLAEGLHVGKVVVSFRNPSFAIEALPSVGWEIQHDASYLITGGCGGFGIEVARSLIALGARHIILVSRSGAASPPAAEALAELRKTPGSQILVLTADASDPAAMASVFARIDRELPVLRGVVHAAGVLDDMPLVRLDAASIRRVARPKADGAWVLHQLTRGRSLDFFVLTSSTAALLGNPGQANYAAANAFLDHLAHFRRAHGLPATVINWGPLAEVGMLASQPGIVERLRRIGVAGLSTHNAIEILARAAHQQRTQIAALRIDWKKRFAVAGVSHVPAKFLPLFEGGSPALAVDGSASDLRGALELVAESEHEALVSTYLCRQISIVLGIAADKIDQDSRLQSIGIDSLMTVELDLRVEHDLSVALPVRELGRNPTVRDLAAALLAELTGTRTDPSAQLSGSNIRAASNTKPTITDACLLTLAGMTSDRPAVICFHPSGGDVGIYRALVAQFPSGVSAIGVRSRDLVDGAAEFASVDAMAEAYADLLVRRHQRPDPFGLVGFSTGAVVAAAVARKLEERDAEVRFVGMIEPPLDADAKLQESVSMRRLLEDFLQATPAFSAAAHALGPATRERLIASLAAVPASVSVGARIDGWTACFREAGLLDRHGSHQLLRRYLELILHHIAICERHDLLSLRAPIQVWLGSETVRASGGVAKCRHRVPPESDVSVSVVPGSHYTVMTLPAVREIALRIAAMTSETLVMRGTRSALWGGDRCRASS